MNPDRFEDPSLKVALKRIYGGERAPAALRERLMRSLADASPLSPISQSTVFTDRPIPPAPLRIPFWSQPSFRAAAAMFVVAFIGIIYYASNTSAASPIQHAALVAMVQTHDQCCGEHEHLQPSLPNSKLDKRLVGKTLADELQQTVWVPDFAVEGWELASAAICTVGAKKSAHLIYAKGDYKLSVFSMSGEGCSSKDGACGQEVQDHVIAGVARGGAVHCIVAHCPKKSIKQEHMDKLLRDHEGEVITYAMATPK
jgi:hypothetical protein